MHCPHCAEDIPDEDLFCESCGGRLHTAPAAPADAAHCPCGSSAIDEEGFCEACGRRVRRPPSDHIEIVLSPHFAAVSDRGQRHDRNEDRCGIFASEAGFALVVCDGVSSSRSSEAASSAVVEQVLNFLAAALVSPAAIDPSATLRIAIAQAVRSLAALRARIADDNPPSTTVVAALVQAGVATIAWVGDSRAYWLDRSGATQLTQDHSWLNEVLATGEVSAEQAGNAPQAHAITRWLGADSQGNDTPDIVQHRLTAPGTLLLTTDGLWNYAQSPAAIAALFPTPAPPAIEQARALIQFANDCGGQDNITAAILSLPHQPAGDPA
jgi:serine/threonine protein phosphatase PrpC